MTLSPTLQIFLDQLRGSIAEGVGSILSDAALFREAITELAEASGGIAFQEEGAAVLSSSILNFVGAGVTLTDIAGVATATIPGSSGSGLTVMLVNDEKADGVDGGSSLTDIWQTHVLNTVKFNGISGASLAADQITLPTGTYIMLGILPILGGLPSASRLRDITGAATLSRGINCRSNESLTGGSRPVFAAFILGVESDIELQQRTQLGLNNTGLGAALDAGTPEVYAQVIIMKLA